MLKIPYGISNFEQIRTKNYLYIDKTHFIEQLESLNLLIHLRPRRFGKSLFISMLEAYYDVNMVDKFDGLFKGLYIHENPTENKNNYYILRLNFSGIQNNETESLEQGFIRNVKIGIENFIGHYNFDIKLLDNDSAAGHLKHAMSQFKRLKLPHKIYVLIDEYDHFANTLLTGDGYDFLELLQKGGFVRSFYEIIKEQSELGLIERLFMTGVMSVTLDSMTSGFNVGTNITTIEDFVDMVGFTHQEVKELLSQAYARPAKKAEIVTLNKEEQERILTTFKQHYNGYLFSEQSDEKVFNSTLIMYYMKHYLRKNIPPKNLVDDNLNQTGTTIENIVSLKNKEDNYKIIEAIIEKKEVSGTLQPFIKIHEKFDENDFITLLFNIGMLTIKEGNMETVFQMPNRIIANIYLEYLKNLHQKESKYELSLSRQKNAILQLGNFGDLAPLTALVSEFLLHTSPRNKIKFDEKYIKLIYLMLLSYTNQLDVYDEFPGLQGYCDLFIQKTPNSQATFETLVELKYIKKSETTAENIERVFQEGVIQIKNYMMDARLSNRENLRKYVVVFSGFDVAKSEEIID